jgi:hypothetical protein
VKRIVGEFLEHNARYKVDEIARAVASRSKGFALDGAPGSQGDYRFLAVDTGV